MSINHPSYNPTGGDHSGNPEPVYCDGCGAELGMYTRAGVRGAGLLCHVADTPGDWSGPDVPLCNRCQVDLGFEDEGDQEGGRDEGSL